MTVPDTHPVTAAGPPGLAPPLTGPQVLPTGSAIVWRSWGQGAPVLLLHDRQGAWSDWLGNIAHLAAGFQVHVADLPPQGELRPEDEQAWVQALREDLLLLCPGVRWRLVGQGWGAGVAARLAPAMPLRCPLVLLWTGAYCAARCPEPAAQWLQHWAQQQVPMLLVWGETSDMPFPVQTALALGAAHEGLEWMVFPTACHPMQQEHATEINAVLTHWLLAHD